MTTGSPPALGRRQLFVYWKLDPAALEPAVATLRALQRQWRVEHPALVTEVFVRSDDTGPATLMETYAVLRTSAQAGVGEPQRQQIAAQGDAATVLWRLGPRHLERFDRCD